MNVKVPTLNSILTSVFGIGGPFCLAVGAANLGSLTGPLDLVITSVGGLLTAIASHHVYQTQAQRKAVTAPKA